MPDRQPATVRRAIVGDDGRLGGSSALEVARFLRETLGASLHVVHAIDVPDLTDTGRHPEYLLPIRAEMAERANSWLGERVAKAIPGWTEPSVAVEFGRPRDAILRAARTLDADLIVLGRHQRKSRVEFGGTQRSVLGNDAASVWSQPGPFVPPRRIIAPVDPSSESTRGVQAARDLAIELDLPCVVLHASEEIAFVQPDAPYATESTTPAYVVEALHEASKRAFDAWFDVFHWGGANVERRFVVGSAVDAVVDLAGEDDLVVMETRGHAGIASILVGGTATGVLERAKGPVVTMLGT